MFTLALSSILAYLDLMNGYNEDNLFDAINSGGSLSLNGYGKLFIFDQMITHRDSLFLEKQLATSCWVKKTKTQWRLSFLLMYKANIT